MRARFTCSRDAADGPFLQLSKALAQPCSRTPSVSIAKSKASSRTQSPRSWQQERRTPTWIIMGHFPVLKSRFTVPAVAQTTSSAHYALCCSQIIFHKERHSLDKFTISSPTQKIPEFLISSEWKETASQILPISGRRVRPASTGDSLGT